MKKIEQVKKWMKDFWCEEDGMGVVEIVLIIIDNPFTSSTYILSY